MSVYTKTPCLDCGAPYTKKGKCCICHGRIVKLWLENFSAKATVTKHGVHYEPITPSISRTKMFAFSRLFEIVLRVESEVYIVKYNQKTAFQGNDTLRIYHYRPQVHGDSPSCDGCYIRNHRDFIKICFGKRRLFTWCDSDIEKLYISELTVWMFGDRIAEMRQAMRSEYNNALPVNMPDCVTNIITSYIEPTLSSNYSGKVPKA